MFETNVTLSKDNHHKAKSPRQMEPEYGHPGRSAQSPPVALLLWVNDFHNQTAFHNFHNLSDVCILSHYISKEKKSVNHTFTTSVTIFHLHFYFHLFNWLGKSKRGHHLTFERHTNPLF